MQNDRNQAGLDFAEVWRAAQRRRSDDVAASDADILKTVCVFCGAGLFVSLCPAIFPVDIVGFF
jgi:hypothetical protein